MTENHKEWLRQLYKDAIKEQTENIANERLWANGSPDAETAQMHLDNINEIEDFIGILTELRDNVGN